MVHPDVKLYSGLQSKFPGLLWSLQKYLNIDVPAGAPPLDTQLLGFLTTNCFPLHITPSLAHFQATLKA